MKKYIGIFCILFFPFSLSAQDDISSKDTAESVSSQIVTLLDNINRRMFKKTIENRYKLYPTENIYTFLELDTFTGKIDQIQWSLNTKKEGSVIINREDLSWDNSSFELYPTKNMYQFILLDKYSGRTWHIQWGMNEKERWIRQIF